MTNADARFNNSLRPRKPEGSLGRTAQDVHLDSHTAPELWVYHSKSMPSGTHIYLMFICTASIHIYHATQMYNCQAHNATLHGSKLARISTLPETLSKTRGRCHVIVATLYVDTVTQVLPLSVRTMRVPCMPQIFCLCWKKIDTRQLA